MDAHAILVSCLGRPTSENDDDGFRFRHLPWTLDIHYAVHHGDATVRFSDGRSSAEFVMLDVQVRLLDQNSDGWSLELTTDVLTLRFVEHVAEGLSLQVSSRSTPTPA